MVDINRDASAVTGGKAVVLAEPLDLSDLESIQRFAAAVKSEYKDRPIDVLINNAGRNTNGKCGKLDLLFQSNFLGHFALTNHLLDKLKGGKIINLSSVMHHFSGDRPKNEEYWKSMALYHDPPAPETYSASKLAAILFTIELNRRYSPAMNIRSMAVNPGAVASDIWRGFPTILRVLFRFIYLTTRQGCSTTVAAAVKDDWSDDTFYLQPYWQAEGCASPHPVTEMLGPYVGYLPTKPRLPDDGGDEAASALWKISEELTRS